MADSLLEVKITGGDRMRLIGKAVRKLGDDRTIYKHLSKRIRSHFPALRKALRTSATETLPTKGGLGARVAKATYRLSIRRGARTAGVSIVISGKSLRGASDLNS